MGNLFLGSMKGLNVRGVTEFCRAVVLKPHLLLPQISVKGAHRGAMHRRSGWMVQSSIAECICFSECDGDFGL